MTEPRTSRSELARAVADRTRDEARLLRLRAELTRLTAQLQAAERNRDAARVATLLDARAAVETDLVSALTAVAASRDAADRIHADLVADGGDPTRNTLTLEDGIPFLLLPLRLETRFIGNELWIRAFPDDIAITSHESALTDEEITRGRAFWTASWNAEEDVIEAAWLRLIGAGSIQRAAWIARKTRPTNAPPEPPEFAEVDRKASSWTAAPRSDVMPDQLVFTLYNGGAVVHQIVGARIPSRLAVGPDPTIEITRDANGQLVLDDGLKWLVDFNEAVQLGLGVRVPLSDSDRQSGFDRLVVLGVRISADSEHNSATLETLFEAHHYSDSLEVMPQGTSTNHTDSTAAGAGRESADSARVRELGAPLFTEQPDAASRTDGERLALALGVASTAFDRIRYADRSDVGEALAMNRALWPATLGYFAEQMLAGKITGAARDHVRELFTQFVSGRGTLPVLRVGHQPYGIIPTTAFSRWRPTTGDDAVLSSIQTTLDKMGETWRALSEHVSRAGAGGDPEHTLIDVLGLHASSVSFHQRRAVGPEYLWNAEVFKGADPNAKRDAHRGAAEQLLQSLGHDLRGVRAIDLELLRTHVSISRPMIEERPLSEERGLDPNYIEWLRGNIEVIRNESYGAPVPSALLYVLLRHAILLGAWDASTRLLVTNGLATEAIRLESEIVHVRTPSEVTRWDHLDVKIPGVTGNRAVVDFVRSEQASNVQAAAQFRDQLAALEILAPLPTARLERLFAEHVDLCGYRFDAWRLAIAARRLDTLRTRSRRRIHLGAYGWLEGVRPRQAEGSGGFIHAPSPSQAVTAAILRAAYVTHTDPAARERMGIDLRSSRVRRALSYVDGIARGNDLAALLGYRFERGLHDRNLALGLEQHLVRLRSVFPLVAGRVHETAPGESNEHVEARNVVDGLRLLSARGQGYPYGVAGLPSLTSPEANAIIAEVDALADDMDALADLILAETVHQAAQGKHERANGVSTGLVRGVLPTEFEVIATPRTGLAITHRVCLLLSATPNGASAWHTTTPRAQFEPAFDAWLGRILGAPGAIRIRVRYETTSTEVRADELGLAPIDFVCVCGGDSTRVPPRLRSRIERLVRARDGVAVEIPIEIDWVARSPAWGSEVRTLFELAPLFTSLFAVIRSRAANAADLTIDTADPAQDIGELHARITAALTDLHTTITTAPARRDDWVIASDRNNLDDVHERASAALARSATAERPLEALVEAAKFLFGDHFNALPRFAVGNAVELTQTIGSASLLDGASSLAIEQWLQGVSRVRPAVAEYENILLLAATFGAEVEQPRIGQLPHVPSARWVGLPMTDATPRDGTALSLIVHTAAGLDFASPMIGLIIDDLTEVVPNATEITGLALQQDRPASEPPQAMLLVVPPTVGNGWQWSDLQQAVIDTFELVKMRVVEPDHVAKTAYAQLLPAVLAPIADRHATVVADFGRKS